MRFMMKISSREKIVILVFYVIAFLGGLIIGTLVGRYDLQRDAIKHGAAQYNQKTAEFEWK